MLDPITHVAFAYCEASSQTSRLQKLSHALSTIGISVLAGTVSTAIAVAVLALAVLLLFSRFALLFCSLMLTSLLYTNVFLAPLLLLVGPVRQGQMFSCPRSVLGRAPPQPYAGRAQALSRVLRSADSASEVHVDDSAISAMELDACGQLEHVHHASVQT